MTRRTRYLPPLMLSTALIVTGVVTASARPSPQADSGSNVNRAEIGLFDRFLDTHPAIAQALAKDPSLIDSQQYVASQPALKAFLVDHPELREQLKTNPQIVMRDLVPFDHMSSPEARAQFQDLDNFMDAHPDMAKQLEANPSLIGDKGYLKAHPDLAAFLQSHPNLAQDWRSHPQAAMMGLASVDAAETRPPAKTGPSRPGPTSTGATGPHMTGPQLSRAQLNALDSFMDSHPAIAKQLEANPSMINSQDYLKAHPELAAFLQSHPNLAQDWRSHPQAAMMGLASVDAAETRPPAKTGPSRPGPTSTGPTGAGPTSTGATGPHVTSPQLSRAQLNALDSFMDSHPAIAKQLEANPSMINSQDYLKAHPELAAFLRTNPDLAEDWGSNPQVAMKDLTAVDAAEAGRSASSGPSQQGPTPASNNDMSRKQAVELDSFLDAHPTLGDQLQSNPTLINNRTFLNDHPDLVEFLRSNPGLAQDWRSNPQAAMTDLSRIDALQARPAGTGIVRAQVATFDTFLNDHPAITEELRAHPDLISQQSYLKSNPQLKSFLSSNPAIAEQLRTNPALFMRGAIKLHTHDIATAAKTGAEVRGTASIHK